MGRSSRHREVGEVNTTYKVTVQLEVEVTIPDEAWLYKYEEDSDEMGELIIETAVTQLAESFDGVADFLEKEINWSNAEILVVF